MLHHLVLCSSPKIQPEIGSHIKNPTDIAKCQHDRGVTPSKGEETDAQIARGYMCARLDAVNVAVKKIFLDVSITATAYRTTSVSMV